MRQATQFLLAPDSSAARRVRRTLTKNSGRSGLIVGTWPELVENARTNYLLTAANNDWEEQFNTVLGQMTEAFWAESLKVSALETSTAIETALHQIVSATKPDVTPEFSAVDKLPKRTRKHFEDIIHLVKQLEGKLPRDLLDIRDLIHADSGDALQTLNVHFYEGVPALNLWQESLITKLNNDTKTARDEELDSLLQEIFSIPENASHSGSLATLQTGLYSTPQKVKSPDDSVQWVGVRDFLEEAEVAAGMVQMMLSEHPDLKPADIGLLLPDSFEHSVAVEDAFTLAGLAVSGLPVERWRQIGRASCRERV